jgi:hypothetical protein
MCRSIKRLRSTPQHPIDITEADIREAALQYIRKVSGYRVPSRANQPAFEEAVDQVARVTYDLLAALEN